MNRLNIKSISKRIIFTIFLSFATSGFSSGEDQYSDKKTIKIDKKNASLNSASVYINTALSVYQSEPELVSFKAGVPGFAAPGEQAWETKFASEEKGLQGLIWVHVETGDIFIACKPGEWEKDACAYIKKKHTEKIEEDYSDRIIKK